MDKNFTHKILSSPLRLVAFIIDALFLVLFCRLLLVPYFLPPDWDLQSMSAIWASVLPAYLIGVAFFFVRDAYCGSGIGKWFLNMRIASLTTDLAPPSLSQLFKRNVFLLLLPVEALYLVFDSRCRRLGDRYAKTVVVELQKIENFRFITVRVVALFAVFGFLWLGYIVTSPAQIEKTSFYRTGAFHLNEKLSKEYPNHTIEKLTEMVGDNQALSLTFSVSAGNERFLYKVSLMKDKTAYLVKEITGPI